MFKVENLTAEYVKEPIGIETQDVRFGWRAASDTDGFYQKSYRIAVATSPDALDAPDMWDSGEVACGRSENVEYKGKELLACTRYFYRVTVTSQAGETASSDSWFEMGLFDENFTGKWITQKNRRPGWAPYLRREFAIGDKPIERVRAYISGLGYGELYINGEKVSDDILDPMLTNYEKIVHYSAYDVTNMVKTGNNAMGVILGDGWYDQSRVWVGGGLRYGNIRLMLELHIFYQDGSVEKIVSDESFKTDFSPVTLNNVHGGETYDARIEQDGWAEPGFDDSGWIPAVAIDPPGGKLVCRMMPPIRKVRSVKPVKVRNMHNEHDCTFIYDMGENFSGIAKITIPFSPAGTEYVLRFAEAIDECGGLEYSSTGIEHTHVVQQDRYITKGDRENKEVWEPRFTYHGFRYIELTGLHAGRLVDDVVECFAVNTDLDNAGNFSCSNWVLTRLQEMTRRTILSNYHGFPEDCPVREKCGWLGDAQLVSEAAMCNFDMATSYEKYMEDIRTSYEVFGTWQMIAPGHRSCEDATPLWGCAQINIPWNLYMYYNDKRVLVKYYDKMKAWVEHLKNKSDKLVVTWGLGDWIPPMGGDKRIPVPVSSTAEFYQGTYTMIKVAKLLGRDDDVKYFTDLASDIKTAFQRAFYNEKKHSYGTQAANAVALNLHLCPEEDREAVAADLVDIIEQQCGGGMATGIYGNKQMIPALTEAGYGSVAVRALTHPTQHSFATMIEKGATSVWEGLQVDGRHTNSSLNHPMHTAFTSWFFTHLLGIAPIEDEPGFKEFTVKPYPVAGMFFARGNRITPYGDIKVSWDANGDKFKLDLTVPANTTAKLALPYKSDLKIDSAAPKTTVEGDRILFDLPGGTYHIETTIY